jgi:serine/threonine protein kinase
MESPKDTAPPDPEPGTSLERAVVDRGWATPEQISAAVKLQAEKKEKGETITLANALITLGVLTAPQVREALGVKDKTSMRCPTCRKLFTVWGYKPGTRTMCKTCKVQLFPAGETIPIPPAEGAAKSESAPALGTAPVIITTSTASATPTPAAAPIVAAAPAPAPAIELVDETIDPSLLNLVPGYRIQRRLGSGGMGDVYLAQQTSLDRPVALKILPSQFAKDQAFVQRFTSEARAAAKVMHENIVAAVDVGESNGRYYFVMELVQGLTVQQTIQRDGPLPEHRALEIAKQVARGLRSAHEQNLIHRDIKPANIMLTSAGVAKICDFGLARDMNTDVTLTIPGLVQSSPAYASPEQCRGKRDLDHRTDMYSLGVTLFEMLTGRRPFLGDTPGALFIKHATEAPPSPQSLNSSITAAANQLVLRLLKKEPRQRFDNYGDLIQAIEAAQKTKALPLGAKSARPATVRRTVTNSKRPYLIAAGAGVVLLIASVFLFTRRGEITKKIVAEPEVKPVRVESESDRLLASVTLLEKRLEEQPSGIPEVRARWKELGEQFRGTPQFPVFSRRQQDFEGRVNAMAEAAEARTLSDAEAQRNLNHPAESLQLLWNFPKAFEGTEPANRIAGLAADFEKSLEARYRLEKDRVLGLLSAGKLEDAIASLGPLKALVTVTSEGKVEFVRTDFREDTDKVVARIEEVAKAQRTKADGGVAKADVPNTSSLKPVDNRGPVAIPDFVQTLRTPALRTNPQERARAAAAFRGMAPRSALCRAAEVFLAHDDRFWKLGGDRLKLKTDQIELDLEGQALVEEGKNSTFQANNGQRVAIQKDGKISINGGPWITPLKNEMTRGLPTPLMKVLGDYLTALPLERADTLTTAEHQGYFVGLSKKSSELGDVPKDVLYLFISAHADELFGQNLRPDLEGLRLSKFQSAKAADYWGPPATVNRVALTRMVAVGAGPLEIRRAIDALSTNLDFPSRYLCALALFRDKEFDPTPAAATWKKLAGMVPETTAGRYCDDVSERLKKASVCDGCAGQGKYPCKKCMAAGIADCDRCKGSGRVKENPDSNLVLGYTVPCPVCKQKGKTTCPVCQGGRLARCEKCDGKKLRKTVPGADYLEIVASHLCNSCSGSGAVFTRTAFPCPDCEGLGRVFSR